MKLAWLLIGMLGLCSAHAAVEVVYRGRLATRQGEAVTDEYDVAFRLYDVAKNGTELWGMKTCVRPDANGNIQVTLADGLPKDVATYLVPEASLVGLLKSGKAKYLGVTVGDALEILPRQEILAHPRALSAEMAKSLVSGANVEQLSSVRLKAANVQLKGPLTVRRSLKRQDRTGEKLPSLVTSSPDGIEVPANAFQVWGNWVTNGVSFSTANNFYPPASGVYWVSSLPNLPNNGYHLMLYMTNAGYYETMWQTPGLVFFGTKGVAYQLPAGISILGIYSGNCHFYRPYAVNSPQKGVSE